MPVYSRALAAVALVGALTACTPEPTPPASGDPEARSVVIAVAVVPPSLDPLAGYAPMGAAKIYDGLVEHQPGDTLRPTLATALPVPAANGLSWTVSLRSDVSFHDGSKFDAEDVVATYRRALDGPLRARFWMLTAVHQIDPATVRFDLAQPFPTFPSLLVLGITRSEDAGEPTIGTGPYRVENWQPGRKLVLKANAAYFTGPPAVTEVTVEFMPDDEVRAQWLRDGRLDGAALPASLAASFARRSGFEVVEHDAADVRVVSLPPGPVTENPAIRLALNLAVDRQRLVDTALAGKGRAISVPLPTALAEFVEPGARFDFDVARAKSVLDAAGWIPREDGVRVKDGVVAAFPVAYPVADVAARDLVSGFVKAAAAVGVQVTAQPTPRDALGGAGAELLAVDDPDRYLADDHTRAATDLAQRAVAYRATQRAYLAAPSAVVLAETGHSYVLRQSWTGYQPVVDATGTDHTWGAWWNLQTWTPR